MLALLIPLTLKELGYIVLKVTYKHKAVLFISQLLVKYKIPSLLS